MNKNNLIIEDLVSFENNPNAIKLVTGILITEIFIVFNSIVLYCILSFFFFFLKSETHIFLIIFDIISSELNKLLFFIFKLFIISLLLF